MRRFVLNRMDDPTGVSGTGIVAEGVVFTDGGVVMRWLTDVRSTVHYDSIDAVAAIHGHGGATVVEWVDGPRVTHGRHCSCSACAREDWTNPDLAHCGMHGPSCPREYAPIVATATGTERLREALAPFAALIGAVEGPAFSAGDLVTCIVRVKAGDIRRAHRVLAGDAT